MASVGISSFRVTFTRWRPAEGERRKSAPEFIQAESFHGAYSKAQAMVRAMQITDPAGEYEIASLAHEGLGGVQCQSGWETEDEFSERAAREYGPAGHG